MSSSLDFSIVIPAYNASGTIDACLHALLHQTVARDRYEVIVVDDGSRDDTAARASAHGVRVIRQENQGPAAARNHGASLAQGTLLLFTDADCEPTPTWLAEMTDVFADPTVQAAKGAYLTRQRSLTARFAQLEFEERYTMLDRHTSIDMIDTYSAAFRTATFRALGGFDPAFPMANNEDTDLSYRLAATGARMVFVRRALVYHQHPASLKKYLRVKYWRGYWRMVVYKRYPDKLAKDTYTPQTLKLQAGFLALAGMGCVIAVAAPRIGAGVALASVLALLATCVSFVAHSWRFDPVAACLSPFFLVCRAAVIGAGAVMGQLSARV